METALREYRVWLETGDLMGCASVYKRKAWYTVELEPFMLDPQPKPKGFRSKDAAYAYALEHAESYKQQAIEYERTIHEQEDCCTLDIEELSQAYSLQVVDNEEGRTLGEWEL